MDILLFNAERVILPRKQVVAPMVLKPRPIPYPCPPKSATLCVEAAGDL